MTRGHFLLLLSAISIILMDFINISIQLPINEMPASCNQITAIIPPSLEYMELIPAVSSISI